MKKFFQDRITLNLFSLTTAEIAKRLLGFITIAYLGRVLDANGFGIIGFASALISYFILFVDFGFNTLAVRDVAKDRTLLNKYVNNIIPIRLSLAILFSLILTAFLLLSDKNLETKYVVLITSIGLFSNAVALNWVFQAVEKMKYIATRQIISGLLSLIGVMLFVHSQNDLIPAAVILTLSAFIGNLWFIPAYKKLYGKIKLEFSFDFWKELCRKSFPLAYASIMIGIYYNLDMVMLGYMKPEEDVGIYNAAYKIFLLGILPLQLIFNSFFPQLSQVGLANTPVFKSTIKNYAKFIIGSGIISGIFLLSFPERIMLLVFGGKYLASAVPLSILAMNVIVVSINVFLGNPMIAWGKQKEYAIAISFGALTNIILNFILIPRYSYIGAAFATLLSEVAVFVGLFYLFNKFTAGLLYKKIK